MKLFLDGFHGYTCKMINMNDYSEYKRVCMCKVISILKVRFPRVRRCHLEQPPPHPVKGKVITVFAPRLHGRLTCRLQVRGLWEDTPHCVDQYQFHCAPKY